jgi:hypothetical protein
VNVPGLVNVNRYASPWFRLPESKAPSAVAVCAATSVFVQQTLVPGSTVIALGSKAKSWIPTAVSPAWQVAVTADLPPAAEGGPIATSASTAMYSPLLTVARTYVRPRKSVFQAGTSDSTLKVGA